MNKKILGGIIGIALGLIIAFIPAPTGLEQTAMRFLGIFIAFVVWLVFGSMPDHLCALLAMALLVVTGTAPFGKAFAPFTSGTTWLIIAGFGLGAALSKCGLLKRMGFFVLKFFPENFRGQIMAIMATGLVLSPMLPSLTAKSVMMAPLSTQVADSLGYKKHSKGASGLFAASFMSTSLFGNAFFTGSLYVFILLGFMAADEAANWNFISWISATWVWLLVIVVLTFFVLISLFKPKDTLSVEHGFAKKSLKNLGAMSKNEKVAAAVLVFALIGWMTENIHGISAEIIAILALILISLFGDFNVTDFRQKIPWTTAVLVAGILSMANEFTATGLDKWLAGVLAPVMGPIVGNIFLFIPLVSIIIYLARCAIISVTVLGTIFFTVLAPLTSALGMSPMVLGFIIFTAAQIYNFSYQQPTEIAAIGATDGDVAHKDIAKSSYAFMVMNIIALLASVPLWMALGLV